MTDDTASARTLPAEATTASTAAPAASADGTTFAIILSLSFDLTTSYQPALWAISGCYALAALAYVALGAPKPPAEAAA